MAKELAQTLLLPQYDLRDFIPTNGNVRDGAKALWEDMNPSGGWVVDFEDGIEILTEVIKPHFLVTQDSVTKLGIPEVYARAS
jgi:hypothetical protein